MDEAVGKLKDEMPIREGRSAVRWIIFPDESTDRWLPVEIVRGYGQFRSPLYTLRQCGDDAARVLLAFYSHEAPIDFWGINPTTAVFVQYEVTTEDEDEDAEIEIEGGFLLRTCRSKHQTVWNRFTKGMRMSNDALWLALNTLEQHGFVYQALTVCSGTSVEEGIAAIYPLHTFNRYGHAPKGEESLASQMNKIAITYDSNCADAEGRFYGKFAFIARGDAQAIGVYRLRFRNTSPTWDESREGWQALQDARDHWEKEAKLLME